MADSRAFIEQLAGESGGRTSLVDRHIAHVPAVIKTHRMAYRLSAFGALPS